MKLVYQSFSGAVWDLYTGVVDYNDVVLVYANTAHRFQDVLTDAAFENMLKAYQAWQLADVRRIKTIVSRLVLDNKIHQPRLYPRGSSHGIAAAGPLRMSAVESEIDSSVQGLYDRFLTISKMSADPDSNQYYFEHESQQIFAVDFNLAVCDPARFEFTIAPKGFDWHPNIWDYGNNICDRLYDQFPYKSEYLDAEVPILSLFNSGRIVFRNPILDQLFDNCKYSQFALKPSKLSATEASSWENFRKAADIP